MGGVSKDRTAHGWFFSSLLVPVETGGALCPPGESGLARAPPRGLTQAPPTPRFEKFKAP